MKRRFEALDGWRGISIILVLAGHTLPIGINRPDLNAAVAAAGMSLFFILSGFLITNILLHDKNIKSFLVRRFLRIVPLAWLVLATTFIFNNATLHQWLSNFFFYANWPPIGLTAMTSHFWSLCVEIQFYIFIAILVLLFKDRFFWFIPVFCLSVTAFRILNEAPLAINTYYRVDEIFCGSILSLVYNFASPLIKKIIGMLNPVVLFILLLLASHEKFIVLNYARPYFALLLVGATIFADRKWLSSVLESNFLSFMASISYALYVFHGGLRETWLGEGDTLERYLKRPLYFVVTFTLAYVSTKYYESYWIRLGKKISAKARI